MRLLICMLTTAILVGGCGSAYLSYATSSPEWTYIHPKEVNWLSVDYHQYKVKDQVNNYKRHLMKKDSRRICDSLNESWKKRVRFFIGFVLIFIIWHLRKTFELSWMQIYVVLMCMGAAVYIDFLLGLIILTTFLIKNRNKT